MDPLDLPMFSFVLEMVRHFRENISEEYRSHRLSKELSDQTMTITGLLDMTQTPLLREESFGVGRQDSSRLKAETIRPIGYDIAGNDEMAFAGMAGRFPGEEKTVKTAGFGNDTAAETEL